MDWTTQLVGVAATALSALLGAWVGARLALSRFKEERSFDHRLQWHIEALRVIYGLRRQQKLVSPTQHERSSEFEVAREQFERIIGESPAFMTSLGWRRLRLTGHYLRDHESDTRRIIRNSGDLKSVLEAVALEESSLDDAQQIVLKGLQRLIPPEKDFRWYQKYLTRALRVKKRIRTRIRSLLVSRG
jgi:hypothetical protein